MNPITVQEQHLSAERIEDRFEIALAWGFDGLELRGKGGFAFQDRLPELQRAARSGVVMPTVCVEMDYFVGAFDDDLRRDAVNQLRSQLSVVAAYGGRGVMTPASYGMFSKRLPPFEPPRDESGDREVLLEALSALGAHAAAEGVQLYLEPLNRYEDHMVNRLEQAASLIEEVGSPAVRIVADTYHMNIEERDSAASLQAWAALLGHVQASDSNRLEPGAGHIDWALFGATLRSIGYDGPVAVESRLSGPADVVLRRVPPLLGRYLR